MRKLIKLFSMFIMLIGVTVASFAISQSVKAENSLSDYISIDLDISDDVYSGNVKIDISYTLTQDISSYQFIVAIPYDTTKLEFILDSSNFDEGNSKTFVDISKYPQGTSKYGNNNYDPVFGQLAKLWFINIENEFTITRGTYFFGTMMFKRLSLSEDYVLPLPLISNYSTNPSNNFDYVEAPIAPEDRIVKATPDNEGIKYVLSVSDVNLAGEKVDDENFVYINLQLKSNFSGNETMPIFKFDYQFKIDSSQFVVTAELVQKGFKAYGLFATSNYTTVTANYSRGSTSILFSAVGAEGKTYETLSSGNNLINIISLKLEKNGTPEKITFKPVMRDETTIKCGITPSNGATTQMIYTSGTSFVDTDHDGILDDDEEIYIEFDPPRVMSSNSNLATLTYNVEGENELNIASPTSSAEGSNTYDIGSTNSSTITLSNIATEDPTASYKVYDGSGEIIPDGIYIIFLSEGDNTITVTVTAESGTTTDYIIKVHKKYTTTKFAKIELISDGNVVGTITYNNGTKIYSTDVANSVAGNVTLKVYFADGSYITTPESEYEEVSFGPIAEGGSSEKKFSITSESGTGTLEYSITVNRTASSDATLKNVILDSNSIIDDFNSSRTYTGTVDNRYSSISLSVEKNNANSNFTVTNVTNEALLTDGSIALVEGSNTIVIFVTAQDIETTLTYTLKIHRKYSTSEITEITLTGSGGNIELMKNGENYSAEVVYDIKSVTLAVKTSNNGVISGALNGTSSASVDFDLQVLDNSIEFIVTPEDGTLTRYTVNVNRKKSAEAILSGITVSSGSLTFVQGTLNYDVDVAYNVSSITITGIAAKDGVITDQTSGNPSTKIYTDNNLAFDGVEYVFHVTSQDENTHAEYKVKVIRVKSTDATLKSVILDNTEIISKFSSFSYSESVANNFNTISLSAVANNEHFSNITITNTTNSATVNGGNIALNVGDNVIKITVTAQNESTTKTYTLNIHRKFSTFDVTTLEVRVNGAPVNLINEGLNNYSVSLSYDILTAIVNVQSNNNSVISGDLSALANAMASKTLTLAIGDNSVNFTITPEDGEAIDYTIKITREKCSEAYLQSLSTTVGTLSFNKETEDYTLNVGLDVSSLTLTGVAAKDATIEDGITPSYSKKVYQITNLSFDSPQYTFIVTSQDGKNTRTYTVTVVRTKSSLTNLATLNVNNKDILTAEVNYNVDLDGTYNQVRVTATAADGNARVTFSPSLLNGNLALNYGDNLLTITVTAQDGETSKKYTVNIRRQYDVATLEDITISEGTLDPVFSSSKYNYIVQLPFSGTNISITGTVTSGTFGNVTGNVTNANLAEGENTFELLVTSEDGLVTQTYVVKVFRGESKKVQLTGLEIVNVVIDFNPNQTTYNVTVENNIKNIDIKPTYGSDVSSLTGDGSKILAVGTNTYELILTAASGMSEENNKYVIVITRKPSSNAYLSSISLDGATLSGFDKDDYDYDLGTISGNKANYNVTAVLEDTTATISGTGSFLLKDGANTIRITVTAEDKVTSNTYVITVYRESEIAKLSNLNIDGQTLIPVFNPNTLKYTINVLNSISKVNILATAASNGTILSGTGNVNVSVGENEFTIEVRSEDKSKTATYEIKIIRPKSNVATLSSLSFGTGTWNKDFNSEVSTGYIITVGNLIDRVTVSAQTSANTATILAGDLDTKNLRLGYNTYTITVTAEDGVEVVVYEYTIYRKYNTSLNLLAYTYQGGFNTINIDDQTSFIVQIQNIGGQVTVIATPTTPDGVEVDIDNNYSTIVDGVSTTVTVKVFASENPSDQTIYSVIFTNSLDGLAYLSSLSADLADLNEVFSSVSLNYTVSVPKGSSTIRFDWTRIHDDATVEIGKSLETLTDTIYNYYYYTGLVLGENKLYISVTSKNGENTNVYTVTITVKKSSNPILDNLSVVDLDSTGSGEIEVKQDETDTSGTFFTAELPSSTSRVEVGADFLENSTGITGFGEISISSAIYIHRMTVLAENGINTRIYILVFSRQAASANELETLDVIGEGVEFNFIKGQSSYDLAVPNTTTSVNVVATLPNTDEYAGATIKGDLNNCKLLEGKNYLRVIVVAQNGNEKVYLINIERQTLSTTGILTYLEIKNLNNKVFYQQSIPQMKLSYVFDLSVDSVVLVGTVGRSDILYIDRDKTIGDTITVDLTQATSTNRVIVYFEVEAESGEINTYEIELYREKLPSDNNYLASVTLDGVLATVSITEALEYDLEVYFSEENVTITGLAEHELAKVFGNGKYELNVGLNKIILTVESEVMTTREYIFNITRLKASSDTYLKDLSVVDHDLKPEFHSEVTSYQVTIENDVDSITVEARTNHPYATVSGIGVIEITTTGTTIKKVTVIGENGLAREYILEIYKKPSINSLLEILRVENFSINEEFSSNVFEYTLTVDKNIENITIFAKPLNENSVVSGDGYKKLSEGNNLIGVTVISESGTESISTYYLSVIRGGATESPLLLILVIALSISLFLAILLLIYIIYRLQKEKKSNNGPSNPDDDNNYASCQDILENKINEIKKSKINFNKRDGKVKSEKEDKIEQDSEGRFLF